MLDNYPNNNIIIILSFWALMSCSGEPDYKSTNYIITYSSKSAWNYDVWYYDFIRGKNYPLTKNIWNDEFPVFSSDSTKLYFVSDRNGNKEIFYADLIWHEHIERFETVNPVSLTNNGDWNSKPLLSPSGEYLCYIRYENDQYEIYLADKDGSEPINVSNSPYDDLNPQFHTDGLSLVYQSQRGSNNFEIISIDLEQSLAINLSRTEGNDIISPLQSISPYGSFIVFSSNRDGNYEIYRMDLNGNYVKRLTDNVANDSNPVVSPDGQTICFVSDRDGNDEIYTMTALGEDVENISHSPGNDYNPVFSPDGDMISFLSDRDKNLEVYLMFINGSGSINISNSLRGEHGQSFLPFLGKH